MLILVLIIFSIIFLFIKLNSTKIKGSIGETKVNINLKFLGTNYICLNDVLLPNSSNSTTQIDQIVLSEYGIFVIETKNYKGWIFGNEDAENWMQVIYKEKHQFRNPVKQNLGHVSALKRILTDFPNLKYFPIVVFAGSATLKKVKSQIPVIYSHSLNRTIKRLSNEKCISSEQLVKIKSILENAEITDKKSRKEHVQNIWKKENEYHIKTANLICPKCGGELKLRSGKYGKFYGCVNYPNCKFTMPY